MEFRQNGIRLVTIAVIALLTGLTYDMVGKVKDAPSPVASQTATTACFGIGAITFVAIVSLCVLLSMDNGEDD